MNEDELDRDVRRAIARAIRERGMIPSIAEVATDVGRDRPAVAGSFARMAEQHVFIPSRDSDEIHAYDPFCVGPTDFRVRAGDRDWWAICGWDALGIPSALGTEGSVDATCGDCGEPIHVEVGLGGEAAGPPGTVLHVGVPAREFWKDIYLT